MKALDLFDTKPDHLTIFGWKEAGEFFEATIPSSIKQQGIRVARKYIQENDISRRPWGTTKFGAWF